MTLFTKPSCEKCHYITDKFDLDSLGIKQDVLEPDNPDALAHLAWHELVDMAERELPILVLDDMSHISGAIKIKSFLNQIAHA
ncbi:Glutaredoxin domain-containing protein [Desulfarculales bacterium]